MWGQIVAVLQAIKALFDLVKFVIAWKAQQDVKAAEENKQALEKAIEQSKVAETDNEIWGSQQDIIKHKPGN